MADTKISALTALAGTSVDTAADLLAIVDTSATTTKKIAPGALYTGMTGSVDVASYATGGTGSSGSPWTGWDTAVTWAGWTEFRFRDGHYSHDGETNFLYEGIHIIGGANTYIHSTGANQCFKLDGTVVGEFTVDAGTDAIILSSGRVLAVDSVIKFSTTGSLPGGLATGTPYYVKTVNSTTNFTVALSAGGATVNIDATAGSGTHTCRIRQWVFNWRVENIDVLGNVGGTTKHGFLLTGLRNGIMKHCSVKNVTDACYWTEACVTNVMENCRGAHREATGGSGGAATFATRPKYGLVLTRRGINSGDPTLFDVGAVLNNDESTLWTILGPIFEDLEYYGIWIRDVEALNGYTAFDNDGFTCYGNTIIGGTCESMHQSVFGTLAGCSYSTSSYRITCTSTADLKIGMQIYHATSFPTCARVTYVEDATHVYVSQKPADTQAGPMSLSIFTPAVSIMDEGKYNTYVAIDTEVNAGGCNLLITGHRNRFINVTSTDYSFILGNANVVEGGQWAHLRIVDDIVARGYQNVVRHTHVGVESGGVDFIDEGRSTMCDTAISGTADFKHPGAFTLSANGAASAPPLNLTGTWFSGGSATTTKPAFLVEPTGTTSTGWSTSGTGLGANAPSGFTGNLLDLQVAGTRQMAVTSGGRVLAGAGDSSNMSLGFTGNAATGFYYVGANNVGVCGTTFRLNDQGINFGGDMAIKWWTGGAFAAVSSCLTRDGNSVMRLYDPGASTAQTLRIYGDGTKYISLSHNGTNALISASSGNLHISSLPTSNPGPGILWNNSGTPAIGT